MSGVDLDLAAKVVEFLNSLVELDRDAINNLIAARVPCGEALAKHPAVQVSNFRGTPDSPYRVGLIGILNGLCGSFPDGPKKGYGPIGAVMDSDDGTEDHTRLVKFIVTDNS